LVARIKNEKALQNVKDVLGDGAMMRMMMMMMMMIKIKDYVTKFIV